MDKLFGQKNPQRIQMRTVVQCPHCGFKITEKMPLIQKVKVFHCPGCHEYTTVEQSACCVFCEFAKQPCPEVQQRMLDKVEE